MPLVIDPSAILGLALDDEPDEYANAVLEAVVDDGALVPSIFWYEIRNVLVVSEWRKRIQPEATAAFLASLEGLSIAVADLPPDLEILQLARSYRLTVYDASYLQLAASRAVHLATLDKGLRAAAKDLSIPVFT
jgi:predicted nucleic acid-binding protein